MRGAFRGECAGFACIAAAPLPDIILADSEEKPIIIESFNNPGRTAVAIVNFSVPDDVKTAFDQTFAGTNKSAVVAGLMRRAVEEAERTTRRLELFRQLTAGRTRRAGASGRRIDAARRAGRS